MPDTLPEAIEPYPEISSKAYEHPADRAATAALKSIPMMDTVVRRLVEFSYERALRQTYLGNSVKASERQLPQLWTSYEGVRHILDMPEDYDLYVTSALSFNAVTIGSTKPMIVVGSTLLEQLGPGEQRVILAHELGHILSDHVLYITALNILLCRRQQPAPPRPARSALSAPSCWSGAAPPSSSCDRAATLAVRDPRIVCRALMVVAAGLPADQLNLDAFMAQAMEYENWEDSHDRIRRFFNEINATHSNSVRRVSEVMKWVQSGEYDRIVRGEYRRRGDETDVRAEASDAFEYYSERFRALFRELGENVTNLGSQVGDVSQQISEWLRNRSGGPRLGRLGRLRRTPSDDE